ncbi:MAG TPA: cytochrome c3 family protein [Burkholderiales bacterium]|nr:cytochrome c3 family protein [Burkholderiales bacterium]
MAQVFQQRQVLFIKLLLLALLGALIAWILAWRWSEAAPFGRYAPVEQPIPFSHKHHVGDDGIDCRYCHTCVEPSGFAGLPSTEVCLTCHSQFVPRRTVDARGLSRAVARADAAARGGQKGAR